MTLTFTYAGTDKPIAGVKITMTEADGTVTILTTDVNGQVTLPTTSNTYTLSASLAETGSDPVDLLDAIWILQHSGELRTLTTEQLKAADVNGDGEVDLLDAIYILQHSGELRTLNSQLIFLDAATGNPLSETTFGPGDTPSVTVVRTGDVDQGFDPTLITDHAPILTGKTTLSIDENETAVSTLVGKDADSDTLTYSITGGVDQALFTINASTGALSFIAGPDYEDPSDIGGDNLYNIEITVSDGVNDTTQTLIISVADLNEKMAMTNKTINENAAGATVGDLSIIDTAFGNTNITYALSGDDATYFVLDGNTLKLKSDVSADYETKSSYTLTVTATNSAGETVEEKVVVKIANVNETPVLATALANQSNDEDSALSFTVPITTFTDVDGDTLTYAATLSDGSALPSWLNFNTSTRVFTGTPVNADVGAITVKVTATDGGSLSATDTFTLTVVNTNDDPTAVTLSATAIDENNTGGVIGTLTTTDDDNIHGDSHTYTLSGADAASFAVVNGQLKLNSGVSANFENQNTYAVTVTSTDGSGSTFVQSFNVSINDVNEAPTNITLSAAAINENDSGAVVGTLGSSDEDAGDSVAYSLSGTHASYFEVVNGQIKLKDGTSANYEANWTLNVTVTATDSGGLTASQNFSISVADVNDVPTAIQLSTNSLQSGETGATVGTLTTSDEDSGENFSYSVNDQRFEIVNGLLKLKAGQSIDYNNEATVALQITVTDSQGAPYTETLTIRVGDIQLNTYSFNENASGVSVGDITVVGLDAGSGFTYSLSGEDARFFEITSEGVLKLKDGFEADYERDADYEITITAENDVGESLSTAIELSVEDVAEAVGTAYVLSGKNIASYWNIHGGTILVTVPEKDANEEVYLFTIDLVDADESGTYNLIVKSDQHNDVSDYFRFDASTGAVYLRPGHAVDFETYDWMQPGQYYYWDYYYNNYIGLPHYHAGTDIIYGGIDYLTFYISDENGNSSGVSKDSNGWNQFILIPGDSAEDGSIEYEMNLDDGALSDYNWDTWAPGNPFDLSYSFLGGVGGEDVTGDGLDDAVFIIRDHDTDTTVLYLVPGGVRQDFWGSWALGAEGPGIILTTIGSDSDGHPSGTGFYNHYDILSDLKLGDINGDGYADIVVSNYWAQLNGFDYDGNGTPDYSDGIVEVMYGAPLETLIARQNDQTWTTFLSPLGTSNANFGYALDIGDINNDGYDDIVVGAPGGEHDTGACYIIYGQASLKINTFNGEGAGAYTVSDYGSSIQYFEQFPEYVDAEFGDAIAVGDFNGDGLMDFAVSQNEIGINIYRAGTVLIYLGQPYGSPTVGVIIEGREANTELGEGKLENLGDVNGDGFDDLGATDDDDRFFIIWGKQNWGVNYDFDGNGTADSYLIELSKTASYSSGLISMAEVATSFNFIGVGD